MSHTDLPEWVWNLLDALDQYEDEHPVLFRETTRGTYERAACFGHLANNIIPSEVHDVAALMRWRNRSRDPWIKEQAWHEGFDSCIEEHRKQREDPSYPMGRSNPYDQVPF